MDRCTVLHISPNITRCFPNLQGKLRVETISVLHTDDPILPRMSCSPEFIAKKKIIPGSVLIYGYTGIVTVNNKENL